jgi:pimeloyl-ACP methyl ester carboxylesterase
MDSQPFRVSIDQSILDDLSERLGRTRWPEEIPGAGWTYGVDLAYLRGLVEYWRRDFDWREQEERINAFSHFKAKIRGLGIHFIHEIGRGPKPLPLLITHGWPSSFVEMLEIIPRLTDPEKYGGADADSFTVIVPSVPGFGFSDKPREPGLSRSRVAELWADLMDGLGYGRYGTHCNDIGAVITAFLAIDHPERLIGMHTLMPNYPPPAFSNAEPPMSKAEQAFELKSLEWDQTEGGYNLLQTTRPQTLAFGLNDSPAGLAAWILDKWWSWGALGDDLEKHFTRDQLLTNITLYWVTQTANSSSQSYYERAHSKRPMSSGQQIHVPMAAGLTREAVQHPPRERVERVYTDIRNWTEYPRGGHFLALEEPDMLAQDIRNFFRPFRPASTKEG